MDNQLRSRLKALLSNDFLRDVSKLSFGTISGRLISLAAIPFVTRLYSPDDFAMLAVYLGLVSIIAVAACLRFEIAIPLVDNEDDAAQLFVLSLLVAAVVSATVLIVVLLYPSNIAAILGRPDLAKFLWLVPPAIFLSASYSTLQYWATRARRFGSIARTRLTQATAGVVILLGMGWMGMAPVGLLLGNMFNIGAGGMRLLTEALVKDRVKLSGFSLSKIGGLFRKYHRYPTYSTAESLVNVAGIQVPVILIAAYAKTEAGFLLLAMQVMTAPMTLLGSSISQVYMSRAPEEMQAGTLAPFTLSIMKRLVQVGVGPLIFVGLVAPVIFPLAFGQEWARAGKIVMWLVPWMALQFIASPVSMVMYVTGRQRAMLVLTIAGMILRVGGVFLFISFFDNASPIIGLLIGSIFYYALVWYFVCRSAKFGGKDYLDFIRSFANWTILFGTASGIFVIAIISSLT